MLALLRLSRVKPVSILAGGWVDIFRNLPLIFLILYFALFLPGSWKDAWEDAMPSWAPEAFQSGLVLGAFLGLVLYNSAVLAEIMRAGILSLPARPGRSGVRAGHDLPAVHALRDPPAGPAPHGPGDRLAADHVEQGHDAGVDHRHHRGHAPRAHRHSSTSSSGEAAPILHVFIFIGFLFVIVNYALSRLSRRLELREQRITGTKLKRVDGLEDQVADRPGLSPTVGA